MVVLVVEMTMEVVAVQEVLEIFLENVSLEVHHTHTVGGGGTGGSAPTGFRGNNGNNSEISGTGLTTITSAGGGGGASNHPSGPGPVAH